MDRAGAALEGGAGGFDAPALDRPGRGETDFGAEAAGEMALILLGVGWNFLYIASSSVLAGACRPSEKLLLQGGNDTLVFLGVTLSTLAASPLMHHFSWETVNLIGAVPVLLLLAATLHRVFRPAAENGDSAAESPA